MPCERAIRRARLYLTLVLLLLLLFWPRHSPLLGFLSDIVWLVVYLVCAFLWDMRKPHAYYSQPGHAMLVAETNGEVVGVAGLLPGVHRKAAKLSRISVAQRVRGRGIGKRLVTEMIDLSRQMGSETLMATTRNLRMQRLLGDLGFRRRNRGFEKDLTMSL